MGIFDLVRGQLVDVIEWKDPDQNTMVYRYDCGGKEIMMGAQLTVRESQVAIMVNEGKLADVFEPGRYELRTQNMPILTALKSWKYGFNSPFKAEVYFINTKQFIDQKWGTSAPVMMRDQEFGMVRLLAHGIYSFKVSDARTFLKEVFGTNGLYTTDYITGQLKRTMASGLSDAIAQSKIPALDLAANYDELGRYMLANVLPEKTAPLGIQISSFVIENISLPEEVQKAMDQRTSMGVIGNMQQYTQYQAAAAMREAASNQNGMAGMGAGFGAAAMMSNMMNSAMNQQPQQPQQAAPAGNAAGFCPACGKPLTPGARFCANCGAKLGGDTCAECGAPLAADAKFCPNCGAKRA